MISLIEHIENHLGEIDQGWKLIESTSSIKVVRFLDVPFDDAVTYVTLGLSSYSLSLSEARQGRQELLFTAYKHFSSEDITSFMIPFAEYMLSKGQALLRGDAVGPSQTLIPNVQVNGVYSTCPVIFDDEFALFEGTTPPTVLVWLIPLLSDESDFIKKSGWSSFEDMLEEKDPDLWDLNRLSILEPTSHT